MKASFKITKNDFKKKLESMLDRTNNAVAFFKVVTLKQYKLFQLKRWQTENVSEGAKWKPLDEKYEQRKQIKFAKYEGAGKALLVATGKLLKNTAHRPDNIVTKKFIKIRPSEKTGYARYVDEIRTISKFGNTSMKKFKKAIKNYVLYGKYEVIE